MIFCTQCGDAVGEVHRFCASCGTPVAPATESRAAAIGETADAAPDRLVSGSVAYSRNMTGVYYSGDYVDRKTLFDDGMLVLTSKDLILYTSDERDELKRIKISHIKSCGYSKLRRGIMVKYRVNEEANFENVLTDERTRLFSLQHTKQRHEDLLRRARDAKNRRAIKEKISDMDDKIALLYDEIKQMEADPTKIRHMQEQVSDTAKEVFKLPKDHNDSYGRTAGEEYRIWEYAVNRRMVGLLQFKIETRPYDAVVTINDKVVGTTPLTIDKPLLDDAVLDGRYRIGIHKEGYEPVAFATTSNLGKGSVMKMLDLAARKSPDYGTDRRIARMRKSAPDRTIDLSFYDVEREIEGTDELLLLTRDEVLVMASDGEQCLLEIPYGAINKAEYDKRFLRGSKAIKIDYNEPYFQNVLFDFWIDDSDGNISSSELRQRSESLVSILNKKRNESHLRSMPNRVRAPSYFIITEDDIDNNFERFEPFEFERLVARLFEKKGYKTSVTQERGDFGIDVLAETKKEKIAIQVKHWKASVGGPDVHKTLGSMMTFGANMAMVVTSSDFTNQAYEIQRRGAPVELWNGEKLRDEFRQYLLDAINQARKNES